MKDSTVLLLAALGAGYYLFVFKPQQQLQQAAATGAGAIGAIGQGAQDVLGGIAGFLNSLFPSVSAAPQPAPTLLYQPGQEFANGATSLGKALKDAYDRGKSQQTWQTAGGTLEGKAYILPKPAGQIYGLTVQQPTATAALSTMPGGQQALASLTTVEDLIRVEKEKQQEAAITALAPQGTRVVGHRVSGGEHIYTLKSPTGAITVVKA